MEEKQIGRLYLTLLGRKIASLFRGRWRGDLARTGMFPAIVLMLLVAGLTLAYLESGRGNFSKIKSHIETPVVAAPPPPVYRPGGQDPLTLSRTRLAGSVFPEFTAATFLPGRGMSLLQMTAYLPDKGEINVLDSPSLEQASGLLSGTGDDADGHQSVTMGGAFEVPWADRIFAPATQTRNNIVLSWRGHPITLPLARGTSTAAADGLLLLRAADTSSANVMPDGGQARAYFQAGDFGAHWPSKTDLTMTVLLSNRTLEITVVAQNNGDEAEPIGIGWTPRFALPAGLREQVRLKMPSQTRIEVTEHGSMPTGRLTAVSGTRFDFSQRGGTPLGRSALDETYVDLRPDLIDSGPVAEIRFPNDNYGLRLTALSPTIKAIHVLAPADGSYISIAPQFNYDDPFGREWSKDTGTGIVTLQPGESAQWKVRLDIFILSKPVGSR